MSSSLLKQVTAAVADEYVVLGQLGENARGSAFLARERARGHLVVLAVPPPAVEVEEHLDLGDDVPANHGTCTACGHPPPAFTVHCQQCGRAFVLGAVGAHRFTHAEVEAAAAHAYDVLGELAHQAGGSLFFVRDRADGRLVALATQQHDDGSQALEAVWDARHGQRVATATPDGPETVAIMPAGHAAALPTAGAYGSTSSGGVDPYDSPGGVPFNGGEYDMPPRPGEASTDRPPGHPLGYRAPDGEGNAVATPARRRRWVPVAVAVAVLVAAGGVWAATHDGAAPSAPTRPPVSDASVRPPTPLPTLPPDGGPAADSTTAPAEGNVAPPPPAEPPPVSSDSVLTARTRRRAQEDSIRRAQSERAYIKLEGDLPAGWTLTVNNRRRPASPTVSLRLNRDNVLKVEASGYCPRTLQVLSTAPGSVQTGRADDVVQGTAQVNAPAPGSVLRWTPRLEGVSGIRECQ